MTLLEILDEFFRKKKGAITVGAPLKPKGKFPLIDAQDVVVDILDYGTPNEKVVTLLEKLQGIGTGGGTGVGISKIAYTGTTEMPTGIIDNYRITFTDSKMEPFDFSIRQGVGIEKISYKSSDGLVDNYEITFTDDNMTPFQFQVRNGRYGDGSLSDADKREIVKSVLDSLPIAEEVSV